MRLFPVFRPSRRFPAVASLLVFTSCLAAASARAEDAAETAIPDAIHKFVERPEPAYRWSLEETESKASGKIHRLHLVSQTWQTITWEHALTVYEPAEHVHQEHLLLFVSGGSNGRLPSEKDHLFGLQLANACRGSVAVLSHVPNQPLFDNRKEDDLITETWLRYLETGDESWPLLFPMVKSAVKAMDALQAFSREHLPKPVKSFVITGASKRGWTSWLTPVVDSRVVGTAPIVIDVLNFPAQTKYQKETWGEYSEQIIDYTSKGLVKTAIEDENERERKLRLMMDPFTYRRRLELPKLMIVGTNDRYWVVDAMNLYWHDLSGPKYALHVPNVGHNLGESKDHALNTLSIFFQHLASDAALPDVTWTSQLDGGELVLTMSAEPAPSQVRLWSASSLSKDFRDAEWTSRRLPLTAAKAEGKLAVPVDGSHVAVFGELVFPFGDRTFSLTTLVHRE